MASKLPSGGSRVQLGGNGANGLVGQKVGVGQGTSLPIPTAQIEGPKREPVGLGSRVEKLASGSFGFNGKVSLGNPVEAEPVQAAEKSYWTVTVTGVGPDGAAYAASFDVEFPRGASITEFNLVPKR